MSKAIDMSGQRFGRWTAIHVVVRKGQKRFWLCRCDCGTEREVQGDNLRLGKTQSCGCLNDEMRYTHGLSRTPTWQTWSTMRHRARTHHRYADRGITVDPRWESFENFLADMGERPPGYTLERINNDGPYSPANCRWATRLEQANNRAHTQFITYRGRTQTVGEWARELGLRRGTLSERVRRGWTAERALGFVTE